MSVLLPTGSYTVRRRGMVLDKHGTYVPGGLVDAVTVDGTARQNAQGIDITLDPEAWPDVDISRSDAEVILTGPDPGGLVQDWIVRSADNRPGYDSDLDELSHVKVYAEPVSL